MALMVVRMSQGMGAEVLMIYISKIHIHMPLPFGFIASYLTHQYCDNACVKVIDGTL